MPVQLNAGQLQELQGYLDSGDFPGAYRFLADINDAAESSDPRTSMWLRAAAEINSDGSDFSFYRSMVRGATLWSANDMRSEQGLPEIGNAEFQIASDQLALDVITSIMNDSSIPSIDDIISTDVAAAVDYLGLDMENWAGTGAADWYAWALGLNLDDASDGGRFYTELQANWESRGIDTFYEEWYTWGSVWIDTVFGGLSRTVIDGTEYVYESVLESLEIFKNLLSSSLDIAAIVWSSLFGGSSEPTVLPETSINPLSIATPEPDPTSDIPAQPEVLIQIYPIVNRDRMAITTVTA